MISIYVTLENECEVNDDGKLKDLPVIVTGDALFDCASHTKQYAAY